MTLETSVWSTELPIRVFAGVSRGIRSGRLKLAIVRARGEGWNLRFVGADAVTLPAPSPDDDLAETICTAFYDLAERSQIPIDAVDVMGLDDSRLQGNSNTLAARIANETGITTVHSFCERDRAAGGQGGPLSPVADWILFRSLKKSRMLIELGDVAEVTLLHAGMPPERLQCFDAGPCCLFLDGLIGRLSNFRLPFDPTGHFAVQGRSCNELISQWKSHPVFLRSSSRFLDPAEFGDAFLESSISLARDLRVSASDVLCSANLFVVDCLEQMMERVTQSGPVDEIWVTGGGLRNGFLWKLLQSRLQPIPTERIDELGIPAEAHHSVHAAMHAFFTMENLPGHLPSLTGARQACVLGSVTPGSGQNWERWVFNLADRVELRDSQAA